MLERTASNKNNSNIAQVGKMRCDFLLGHYSETIEDANEILNSGWIDDELAIEAHFTVARSAMFGGDLDLALKEFRKTCEKSQAEEAAESQYHIAAILYEKGKYKEAEDEVFKLINTYPSYDYWLARGFILLADIYVMNENIFQAKQTLISIIENYEGPDLGEMAQDKLNAILIKERLEQESLETEAEEVEEDDF
jgi:TolA-binding protein